MRVPLYLAVSDWVVLFALGILVILMYRQLGRVFGPSQETPNLGPAIGAHAESFEYTRVNDSTAHLFAPGQTARPALLAFVNPMCPTCELLVESLGVANADGELSKLQTLLLISDPPEYLQISNAFSTTTLEIGRTQSEEVIRAYNATATPLLVAIDSSGTIRAARPAAELDHVRALAQAAIDPPVARRSAEPPDAGETRLTESLTRA